MKSSISIKTRFFQHFYQTILWFCLFLTSTLFAQEPFVRKISFLEGLPTQVIYDCYVAKNGLLYLGTDKGLISFDGVRFKEYPFNENLGLAVNSIQEDSNGTIWCKNFANQLFYLDNSVLILEPISNKILQEEANNLVDYKLIDNQLWLLTEKKFFLLRKDKSPKIILQFKLNDESRVFSALNYNSDLQKLYVASLSEMFEIDKTGKINSYSTEQGQKEIEVFKGKTFYNIKANKNGIWDVSNQKFNTDLLAKNAYFIKMSATTEDFWLCTSDGFYLLNTNTNSVENGFLKGKRITDIVQDKEGSLWVSTLDEGLYFIPYKNLKKLSIHLDLQNKQPNFSSIIRDKNNRTFVGTSNGKIIEFNQNNQQVFVYDSKKDREVEYLFLYEDKIISSVGVFDQSKKTLIIDDYFGKNIAEDDAGNFMIASYNSAGLFPKNFSEKLIIPEQLSSKETVKFGGTKFEMYLFRNKRSRSVYYCKQNKIYYIGFSDGLFAYEQNKKITEIKTNENKPIIASRIIPDANGSIWIASSQQGLLKITKTKVDNQFSIQNGLSSNHCKRIGIDANGIWVLTDNGIDFLAKDATKPKNISLNLGLKGISINDMFLDETSLWLATNEGVIFTDKSLFQTKIIPNFRLLPLKANQELVQNANLIQYHQNNIEFDFETIHYKSLGNYTYEFRLKEVDTVWSSQPSTHTKVNFLALQPGNYTFEARVKSGEVYSPIQTNSFTILKPFWQSAWFLILCAVGLFLLIYFVFQFAVARVRKKQEIKEKLALSQLTALRSQMNPHFMYNVLNAVQGLIYSNQKTKASDYLGTFSDLMRKTLDISDKKEITIQEEMEAIELYVSLEKARFETNEFDYCIQKPEKIDLNQFLIPSLIVQPFVENAIKHGLLHKKGLKKLEINIEKENENYWLFQIKDNGIGRKKSELINQKIKKHNSFATQAISNRIELINKMSNLPITIEINDVETKNEVLGTHVILHIPVIKM